MYYVGTAKRFDGLPFQCRYEIGRPNNSDGRDVNLAQRESPYRSRHSRSAVLFAVPRYLGNSGNAPN